MAQPNKLVEIAEDSARGGFFLFAGNASSLLILLIASIVVARLLGPEDYGMYSLSLVVPTLLAGLSDLGISSALIRFVAKFRAEGRIDLATSILKSGFIFKLILGIAVLLVCFVFSDLFAAYVLNRPGMGSLVKIGSLLALFLAIFSALSSSFIGLDRMEGNALILNMQATAKTILSPMLVVLGFGVIGALMGHIFGYAIAVIAGIVLLLKYQKMVISKSTDNNRTTDNNRKNGNNPSTGIKMMLNYGYPLYLSALIALFFGQYQTIILAHFASNFEVGNFSIAVQLSSAVRVLIFPLGALFPAFSKIDTNRDHLKRAFSLSVKYVALFIIPATIVLAILSKDLVYTLYGASYDLAPAFLSLYVLVFLYTGCGYIVINHLLSGVGETKLLFKSELIGILFFLPSALLLTSFYGPMGLIISFLISTLFPLIYRLFITNKKIQVKPDISTSLKIFLASIISATPTILLLQFLSLFSFYNLIVGGLIYLLTYLSVVPLIGIVKVSDINNFTLMFNKIKIAQPIVNLILSYETRIIKLRALLIKEK